MTDYARHGLGVPITKEFIGWGDQAVYTTVNRMRGIIQVSSANPLVRDWAKRILGDVPVNAALDEATAIHDFVRDNIRYTRDPKGIEFVQTPPVLLAGIEEYLSGKSQSRPIGDCDDMTTLSLSLLKSVGFETVIKTVSFHPSGKFSHVYGMVNVDGEWMITDSVRPDREIGWESSGHTRTMELAV